MPQTLEGFLLLLGLVAPGYIVREIISLYRPKEEKNQFEILLDSLILGFFNLFIFTSIFGIKIWIQMQWFFDNKFIWQSSIMENIWQVIVYYPIGSITFGFIYFLLVPYLIGLLLGKMRGRKFTFYPSAWDEFFSTTTPVILYLTLKSGKNLCGIFSENSRASTNLKKRDLYLEKEILLDNDGLIDIDEKGNYPVLEDSNGFWIRKDEIEFFKIIPYKTKGE